MRLYLMFVTAVCVLFLIKLRWPKKKTILISQAPDSTILDKRDGKFVNPPGGDSHMEQTGMFVGNFEFNP